MLTLLILQIHLLLKLPGKRRISISAGGSAAARPPVGVGHMTAAAAHLLPAVCPLLGRLTCFTLPTILLTGMVAAVTA